MDNSVEEKIRCKNGAKVFQEVQKEILKIKKSAQNANNIKPTLGQAA